MARAAGVPTGSNVVTKGLHSKQATYRKRIQTGTFDGQKRTCWIEFNARNEHLGSYWEDDSSNMPVKVYYD